MDEVRCRLFALLLLPLLFVGGRGLLCPSESDCDRSKCDSHELWPPSSSSSYELRKNCSGGVVRDVCGCCDQCAKVKYEKCGGLHGLSGQCDRGLVCVVMARHGQPITGHEDGQCLEPRDSCASLKNYSGCNLVDGSCLCSVVSACEEPRFDFVRLDDCYRSSQMKPIHKANHANCTDVHCGDTMHILCSADSIAVAGEISPGECCPKPGSSTCRCNPELCHVPECIPNFERVTVKKATGVPGECCDIYECVYLGKNCSSVECSDSQLTCPEDSYALPGMRTEDECCSRPQGCACLPIVCKPATCPTGQRLNVVQAATGKPGSCCDQFRCLKENEKTCIYDGREYVDGSVWKADKCTFCTCKDGLTQCGSVQCQVTSDCGRMEVPEGECCPVCTGCVSGSGLLHKTGESWKTDECITCVCNNGKVECQAEMCDLQCTNPRYTQGQCCPQCDEPTVVTAPPGCPPLSCSISCSSGFQRDYAGCFMCQCKLDDCNLSCVGGYETDSSGQLICKCRCPPVSDCNKNCSHGLRLDSNGCETCRCVRCRSLATLRCSKKCLFGHVRNDRGCRTCKCMDAPESAIATTDAEFYNTTALVTDFPDSVPTRSSGSTCRTRVGTLHDEGEMWHDGCRNCYCHAGKEMCGLITCPVPMCPHPVIFPSDCCPRCLEDAMLPPVVNVSVCQAVDGLHHIEGETWDLDPCTYCICHNGQVLCTSHVCPPAPCSNPLHGKDRCCATCPRDELTTAIKSAGLPCSSDDETSHEDGASWRVGACQSCLCSSGKISCYSDTCPKLGCDKPVLKKDQCCPFCLDVRPAPVCIHEDLVYVSGEMWSVNACTQCVCVEGQTMCKERICSVACVDPIKLPGQCCLVCPGIDSTVSSNPDTSSSGLGCSTKGTNKCIDGSNDTWPMMFVHIVLPVTVTLLVISAIVLFICFRRRHKKFHFESEKLHNNSVSDVSYSRDKNVFFRNIDCVKKENCNLLPFTDDYNKNCDVPPKTTLKDLNV